MTAPREAQATSGARHAPRRVTTTPSRAFLRCFGLAALLTVFSAADACVVADPPTDLPTLPEMRPTIVRASVVPSASSVLGAWPTKFIVPVEVSDPRADIAWSTFVDYNAFTGAGLKQTETSKAEPNSRSRVRVLEIPIPEPSLDRCHVVEVVVALRFSRFGPHIPEEPPGGDIVSWFFNPTGDLAGCPSLDAGAVPLSDGGADADAQ
ncbi:MAG TPA: hypothetical protein VM580_19090 [Labilithrix sp.]|nr:hypothetical protein [Labilithrix sp.]